MPSPIEDIKAEVQDLDFAKEYGEELAKINMAVTMAKAREERGLTQEQLAEKARTSQPYIAKLESGYANPSIGAIAKILAVMGFRFVPGKDSLVPEVKPSSQGVHSFTAETERGINAATSGFVFDINTAADLPIKIRDEPRVANESAALVGSLREA